ncbi:AfsA-related hotdog domain-containing protein [Micromonospora sp. NPDC050397]|uniref:AfsA-related hotdog domain-containing protein n=1 Tax=Micromonospora sp. NPDC050397 TaxID=3364279 RepID=UPI00384F7DE1
MDDRSHRILFVVGDRFATGVGDAEVVAVSRLLTRLRAGCYDNLSGECRVILGQGVSTDDETIISHLIQNRRLTDRLVVRHGGRTTVPAARVHKQRQENVLLADLRRTDEHRFSARLVVHDDNELVLDHVSGWHIPGMLIHEAARQMILAVTETYYVDTVPAGGYRYVLESWHTSFEEFLFPLDATVHYAVDKVDTERPDRLRFEVTASIVQAGRRTAQCSIVVVAFDADVLTAIEQRRALRTMDEISTTATEFAL